MNQFSSEKILKHLDRILEWQTTRLSRPITYELDMTNVCNSKCPFCFGFYERERNPLSIDSESVKDIILQIKKFGGKGITFTGGGEPLCNPSTIDAVVYARKLGLDVGFITNGLLLGAEKAETLVKHCTWIRVSLDAGSPETYVITHGLNGNHFKQVLENTSLLASMKRKNHSNVTIGTGFLTFPEVLHDMRKFVEVSRSLGVDYAQFRPLLRKYSDEEINATSDMHILKNMEECRSLANNTFQVLCSTHKYGSMKTGGIKRGYGQCYGQHFAAVIAANRKMYICCHMRGIEKYCIGDLGKDTLEKVWKSRKRKRVYENIKFKECPLLCRCDGLNTILWSIVQEKEHENFL